MNISPVSSNVPLSFQSIELDKLAPETKPVVDSTKSEQNVVQTNAKITSLRAKISSLYSQITRQQVIATVCSLAAVAFVGIAAYKFSQPAVSDPTPDFTSSNPTVSDETVSNFTNSAVLLSNPNTTANLTRFVHNYSGQNVTLENATPTSWNHGQVDPNKFAVVPEAVSVFEFIKPIEYQKHLDYSTEKVSQANEMLYNIKLVPQGYRGSDDFNRINLICVLFTLPYGILLLRKYCFSKT